MINKRPTNRPTPISMLIPLIVVWMFIYSGVLPAQAHPKVQESVPTPHPGVFSPAPCWTTIPPQMAKSVSCGYVSVPERHANPDGPQIRLAVMVIKASVPNKQPDPLFFLQGGPGGSTIDTYAEILLTRLPLVTNRDMVLFDQRGALYSQPSLVCSEYDQLVLETIEEDIPDEEYYQKEAAAYQACRQRLVDQGVDLGAYNSFENAADIQAIRQALGYDQINLYGVSYGTLLALHTMRFFPENLRSAVLDAVVPPQTNFLVGIPQTTQRAFSYLFEACKQDKKCSRTYPDLENRVFQLVEELNQSPVRVPMTDPDSGVTYQALINGDSFLDGVFQLMYVGDLLPAMPMMIADAENGDFTFFARIMSILVFDRSYSYGMYFSVLCSEDADFTPDEVSFTGVNPQIAESQSDDAALFLKTCQLWDVEALDLPMDDPVQSQLPVLVLSGSFDPITPPENGLEVAQTLPNSYVIEFPTGSHGAALDGDCQDQIIRSFLDQPEQPPATNCIEPLEAMQFFTSASVIKIPATIQLLNLESNRPAEFLILTAAALFLLPGIFIIPGRWLWRKYRSMTPKKPAFGLATNPAGNLAAFPTTSLPPSSQAPRKPGWNWLISSPDWLIWLYSLITWLFLSSFFAIMVFMLVNNDSRLYFGLPGQSRFLFILPLILLATEILLAIAIIKRWATCPRNYFSKFMLLIIFFVCLVVLIILAKWEVLLALF